MMVIIIESVKHRTDYLNSIVYQGFIKKSEGFPCFQLKVGIGQ